MYYRRATAFGATWFFTINLANRRESLLVDHIDALRDSLRIARVGTISRVFLRRNRTHDAQNAMLLREFCGLLCTVTLSLTVPTKPPFAGFKTPHKPAVLLTNRF